MKTNSRILFTLMFALASVTSFATKMEDPSIGQPSPDFELINQDGKNVKLSDFKDKTVVLEWQNEGCPFVKKHYGAKNMQRLQEDFTKEGVVWLTVISSKKGSQGYLADGKAAKEFMDRQGSKASHILLDPKGIAGRLYGAKTTPHMFVVHKQKLAYKGAIDSEATTDAEDIAKAKPFFKDAVTSVLRQKTVAQAETEPYGCSIKY